MVKSVDNYIWQWDEAKKLRFKYNNENSAIIFQLGTNGPFTESQLDELVKIFDKD